MTEQHVYTVSELNRGARELLETEFADIWLRGEIADWKRAPSGHIYFSLTDGDSEISAARFRGRLPVSPLLDEEIQPGTAVLVFGRLTVYEPRGRYQFIATLVRPVGAGALQQAFEALKKKLQSEGLFDPERKKPLPTFPRHVAVITSSSGAAFHDIVSVFRRRWPVARLYLFASAVQGDNAPGELAAALESAIRFSQAETPLDLVIIGRGGGSAEDLAAFNDEALARAISVCPIPCVSAVGHEIDFSISDFVADVRAPTPTAAAEVTTPDQNEILSLLRQQANANARRIRRVLVDRREQLDRFLRPATFRAPRTRQETLSQQLDTEIAAIKRGIRRAWQRTATAEKQAGALLAASNPHRPLERGYSITTPVGSPVPIRSADELTAGTTIETRFKDGRATSTVDEVTRE